MSQGKFDVEVKKIESLNLKIKSFELTSINDEFTEFTAGGHITLDLGSIGLKRSYSLLSDPKDTNKYIIAVRLDDDSQGGSRFMHETLKEGDKISIYSPNNYFPLVHDRTQKHILIAGGIGITPFLSYLYEIKRYNLNFELHYCINNSKQAGYIDFLQKEIGEQLFIYDSSNNQRLNADELIEANNKNAHFYVCGPDKLTDNVIEICKNKVDDSNVHFEKFNEGFKSGNAFEIYLQKSDLTITVESDMSILQAIEASESNISVECLCRNGVCGTCETVIISGKADHKDMYLTEEEQEEQKTMMICVSRSKSSHLVLDL